MKTAKLLLGLSLIVLFSCNQSSEKGGNDNVETNLSPQTNEINGVFSTYFELVDKKYDYVLEKPKDDLSLPSFEMPIELKVTGEYNYNAASKNEKFDFNLHFINKDGEIIDPLSVNTVFEVVKYYNVNGIDFKKLLTSEVGNNLTFKFKTFIKKENVDKIKEAKSFRIEIIRNTPEARLKSVANSLDRAAQISSVKLQGDIAIIEYKEQVHDDYWASGKKIQKTMVGSPARIMMKLDFVNRVKLTIPFNDKIYRTDISKQDLEQYIGSTMEEIRNDWSNKFSDVYIYNLNNPKREAYFNKFVKIE
jgi:hypothetical protein